MDLVNPSPHARLGCECFFFCRFSDQTWRLLAMLGHLYETGWKVTTVDCSGLYRWNLSHCIKSLWKKIWATTSIGPGLQGYPTTIHMKVCNSRHVQLSPTFAEVSESISGDHLLPLCGRRLSQRWDWCLALSCLPSMRRTESRGNRRGGAPPTNKNARLCGNLFFIGKNLVEKTHEILPKDFIMRIWKAN